MQHIVIVGNGMVGHRLTEELHARDPHLKITVLSEERHVAYDRVQLSHYFDEPRPDLSLTTHAAYQGRGVSWLHGKALSADRAAKTVTTETQTLTYDLLVLAKGLARTDKPLDEAVRDMIAAGVDRMDAIKTVAHERGLSKREVYRIVAEK